MAYLVIEWLKNGEKVLKPPQLEAIGSTKVITLNGREEGKPVMMQFKNSLWEGKIISLHEKMSAAKQAVNTGCRTPDGTQRTASETPETASETPESGSNNAGKKSRERKRKSLGPDFASAWPEDSNSESETFDTLEEQEMSASSSSAESAETDGEDTVTVEAPKPKERRKQNERKESASTVRRSGSKKKGKGHTGEPSKKEISKGKKQSKLCTKEQRLQIVAAQSQRVKEMVTIDLCNEAPPSDKRVPEGCKNLLCAAEKERLREEIKALKQTLADHAASTEISEQGGGSQDTQSEEPLRYGKVPRRAALNRKWEEIGNGAWICPLRVRAAQKEAKSKTAFARILLMHFYKKEELKGKRLTELDQDIVHAIAEFAVVAKLAHSKSAAEAGQDDSNGKKGKKPPAENKAAILQSLRTKMNNLLQEDGKSKGGKDKKNGPQRAANINTQSKEVVET